MKKYIILNGQNKVPDNFVESSKVLNNLLENNFIDSVIITTWRDDINNIIKESENFKILTVEKPKKGLGLGNIWAQMIQYESAIKYIKNKENNLEDVYILRSRPDIFIKEIFIKEIFKNFIKNKQETGLFKSKVWISYFDISKPFYMAGDCWGGHILDMMKFINYRTDLYPRHFQGISHVRIYIEPFLKEYPILVDYLKNKKNICYGLVSGNNWGIRKQTVLNFINDQFYIDILKLYYFILNKYFYVDNGLNMIKFREWSQTNEKHVIKTDITFKENMVNVEPLYGTFILGHNNEFINKVNEYGIG